MITADLCRDVAIEAARRGAPGNPHELWALLEAVEAVQPDLIVDVGSKPAVWWAWWSVCSNVIGVTEVPVSAQPAFSGPSLPSSVVTLVGPMDASTALRVTDQIARRPVDVLVIRGADEGSSHRAFNLYAPKVRRGGLVVVAGIANPATPGVTAFWRCLDADGMQELIGATDPDGYGIFTVPGQVSE
jgi:hypothetical protein